uniref:Uncharacterized protein n=1 Tax=Hyaloperonospora arabidopsidis (strain Emoy2) TaxID=559515 RepID=M4B494_HYAAE
MAHFDRTTSAPLGGSTTCESATEDVESIAGVGMTAGGLIRLRWQPRSVDRPLAGRRPRRVLRDLDPTRVKTWL